MQQFQSDTLLQTRLNWYEGILNKNKEETTTEENTNHKGIGFSPILSTEMGLFYKNLRRPHYQHH